MFFNCLEKLVRVTSNMLARHDTQLQFENEAGTHLLIVSDEVMIWQLKQN